MKDVFDAKISCKQCNVVMEPVFVAKGGFKLRAVQCDKCGEKIIHPADLNSMERYNNLKRKTYSVKLRVVGNSHAVSIPKEIVDFINETRQKMRWEMNDMVRLCFEDFGKLSLDFADSDEHKIGRKSRW